MGSITEDLAATASAVPQPRPSGRKLSIAPLPTANTESRVRQVPPVERRRRSSLALNLAQRPPIQGASANPPRIPTLINLADRVRSHSDDALRNRPFTADPACGGERPFMFPSRRRVGISFSSENNASNLTRPRNKSSSELESVSHVWKNGVFVKKLEAFWEYIHVFDPNLPVTPIAQENRLQTYASCQTFMRFCCHLQKIACRQAYKMHYYAKILQLSSKEVWLDLVLYEIC